MAQQPFNGRASRVLIRGRVFCGQNVQCASGSGCLQQALGGAVDCVCEGAAMAAFAAQNVAPPPPPPVVGSAQWLKSKEHVMVAPGPEAAQSGLNMAMYQAGPLAVNLADYLRHKADEEEVRTRVRAACRTCALYWTQVLPGGPCYGPQNIAIARRALWGDAAPVPWTCVLPGGPCCGLCRKAAAVRDSPSCGIPGQS